MVCKTDALTAREIGVCEEKALRLMKDGFWIELADNLKGELSKTGNDEVIKSIIYKKSFRPTRLSDQMKLLKKIYLFEELELCHRLGAVTAYSHKAMESIDYSEVENAILLIEKNLEEVEGIGRSKRLREDSLHIHFSMLSVLWHLYFFIGDFDSFLSVGKGSLNKIETLTVENVGPTFYQTCTNVMRVLLVSYLSGLVENSEDDCLKSYTLMKNVLWLGLVSSDYNKVKFEEFLGITSLYHDLNSFKQSFDGVFINKFPSKKGIETVIKGAMRPHGREKMLHMEKLIDDFYHEIWG